MPSDLPVEVLSTILFRLARSDLLSCRLVNQSWNQESLLVFRKSSFTTHLNIRQGGGNAEKYIEFTATKNPQLLLPIHLSLESLHLPHPKIQEIVTSLQAFSGPDSIHGFTLHIDCNVEDDVKMVMILLSKISHALKTLEVKYYAVASTELLLSDLIRDLEFPNVTSLKYLAEYPRELRKMVIEAQSIHNCTNLKQLCLETDPHEVTLPLTLQKLDVKYFPRQPRFRNDIHECSRLHTLKIRNYRVWDRQIIYQILESLAKTLKSLTIGVHTDPMFQFPQLPYLESLRLHSVHGLAKLTSVVGFNPDDMNLNSETFPSLKLTALPFIFFFLEGSPVPSVETLILLVSANVRNSYDYSDFSIQENFKNLTRMFPNATTVSLKQGFPDTFPDSPHKIILNELISSELAPQIHQIQIDVGPIDILGETMEQNMIPPQIVMNYSGQRNYEAEALIQDAFGLWTGKHGIKGILCNDEGAGPGRRVVFTEGGRSGHKMTNVKKVKLVFRSFYSDVGEKFPDLDGQLNLMSITKSLPSLTEMELFGIQRELYLKQFDDLAIEYPNLLLRITKHVKKKPIRMSDGSWY